MKSCYFNTFLFLFFTCVNLKALSQDLAHVSRIKIHASVEDLQKIKQVGIEFDHGFYDHENSTYVNETEYSNIQKIISLGLKVDILVFDVFRYTDSLNKEEDPFKYENEPVRKNKNMQNMRTLFTPVGKGYEEYITTPSSFKFGSMGGFYNLQELEAEIDDMVAKYPSLVTKSSIGNTLMGLPVWVVKISDNAAQDEAEAEVLYTGMHHSREGMSMMNLIYFMRYILENYSKNSSIKEIIDNRELFFIPVVNIDGFNYNTTKSNWDAGRRMRRKNMRETTPNDINPDGSSGDGVDINRNYGTYWGSTYANNNASSGTGYSDAYRGTDAFSEPETQNMRAFINNRKFKVAINYHCYGNWWIRPQGPDSTAHPSLKLSSAATNTYNSIASLFTKYNCYVYGTPHHTVYPVNGYSDDWFFSDPSHDPVYSFSPEIGDAADGFWCPQSKIIPYAKEQIFANLQAAYSVGSYADLHDQSDLAITTLNGNLNFSITRRGLSNEEITVELIPLNNIQSVGDKITIPAISNFGGIANGSISYTLPTGLASGSVIRYIWQLKTGGITINDTIIKLYNPGIVFSVNMDIASNFSNNWERSGTSVAWNYASNIGLNGTSALTESPSGNYANSADHIIRLRNPLDLSSSTQAYLSFMIKYNSENCKDRLQIEISTTGVNGTYVPISTMATITENKGTLAGVPSYTGSTDSWIREIINLTSYSGNNNIGLRFRFRSNSSNAVAYSRDGFAIDDFRIAKTSATILPVAFYDINAVRLGDNIRVSWKAEVEENFDYYEIERSRNGVAFEKLGMSKIKFDLSYIDENPLLGKNYYRIKAIGKDGEVKFSKIVMVVFEKSSNGSIYPNPFNDVLNIEIINKETKSAVVEFITVEGKLVRSEKIHLKLGNNLYTINTTSLPNQFYLIRIVDENGILIKTAKLHKSHKK